MADEQFTQEDAEAAGWRIVHEGVDPNAEDATANATYHRAEKYHSPPGATATLIEETAADMEQLFKRIAWREQWLGNMSEVQNVVLVPAKDHEGEADTTDTSTFERVSDAEITAARQNDVLTVLSDPEDPDSDPVQKVVVGGQETSADVLSEPASPNSATQADVLDADKAATEAAVEARDSGDTTDAQDVAQARHESLQDAHDDARASDEGMPDRVETVQPEAGEATDASDSEQQGQVPDSEAASSDAVSTNVDDGFAQAGQSQPEVVGPDTDAEAPAPAPNAGQDAPPTEQPA